MGENREPNEISLDNVFVEKETKNNVMYAFWCQDVKFYGFEWGDEGHLNWQREFIQKAKQRAYAIQFETNEYGYSRATKKAYKREISRRLTPKEVIEAVKLEYKNDYALLQFRIIHNELKTNKNPLADLFIPEIVRYNWVGIFHTQHHYEAFLYILDSFHIEEHNKVLFMGFWGQYGGEKILMRCNETKWRDWVIKNYLPNEKDSSKRWKHCEEIHHSRRQMRRYEKTFKDPNIFKQPYARNKDRGNIL
jgi:hypothetical protein